MKRYSPLVVALVIVLAACGSPDDDVLDAGGSTTVVAAATGTAQPSTTATATTIIAVDLTAASDKTSTTVPGSPSEDSAAPQFVAGDDPVAFAIADLAHRLGIAEEDVTFVEQHEVMWRDGSIGCPQPGFSYTQALVDGSRIVFEVDGATYAYHQARGLAPFYCENPQS